MLEDLKRDVCAANLELVRHNLVMLTWGNVSGIDRERGLVAIKPSGVSYDDLKPEDIVLVDLDGVVVEGKLNPSSDTPTHLALYKAWPEVGGISHTHSRYATMFSQAMRPVPCFGTTHADHYHCEVPVTRAMTNAEVESDYEANTGAVIIERFQDLDRTRVPSVLVANHGPFCWGLTAMDSVTSSLVLEEVARMALGTLQLNPQVEPVSDHLHNRHFLRKHGPDAYYGPGGDS